jgi:hypothetical protein
MLGAIAANHPATVRTGTVIRIALFANILEPELLCGVKPLPISVLHIALLQTPKVMLTQICSNSSAKQEISGKRYWRLGIGD